MNHADRHREMLRIDLPGGGWLQGQWSHAAMLPDFAVVFIHGFCSVRYGEKAQALEECCAKRGWTFASFDMRGHGESSGMLRDLRGSGLIADLDAIFAALSQRGVRRLAFLGSSMGGWAAAWYGLLRPERVIAIGLIAPGFHILTARWEKLTEPERAEWKRTGVLTIRNQWLSAELGYGLVEELPQFPPERLLRDLRVPTLIFQGMRDDIVPADRTIAWLKCCANPRLELRLYKDGDHRLTDRKLELAEATCEFVARQLGT
jgi:pimeloyl-ACP methyl ester carboxylesterase